MADTPHNTRALTWATAFNTYITLSQSLNQAQPQDRDRLERAVADAQDELLDTPAPSFSAVREKLEILWEGHLDDLDQSSEEKRLILEDLSDLIAETQELLA